MERLDIDRGEMVPFYLRLFHKTQSFHNTQDFLPSVPLPEHISIYTWADCTLHELVAQLYTSPSALKPTPPTIGTRLVFRLVYPDQKAIANANAPANFFTRHLGSVIINRCDRENLTVPRYQTLFEDEDVSHYVSTGRVPDRSRRDGNTWHDDDDVEMMDVDVNKLDHDVNGRHRDGPDLLSDDRDLMLQDTKFVTGDYITVTILPPGLDGAVQSIPPIPIRQLQPTMRTGPPERSHLAGGGDMGGHRYGNNGGGHGCPPKGRRGRLGPKKLGPPGGLMSSSNSIPIGDWRNKGDRGHNGHRGNNNSNQDGGNWGRDGGRRSGGRSHRY